MGRSYWAVFLDFRFEKAGKDDSRVRFAHAARSVVTFGSPGPREVTFTTREETIRWEHDGSGSGSVQRNVSTDTGSVPWDYLPGGGSILISGDEPFDFALSPNGDVLASSLATSDGLSSLNLMIEKPSTAPSIASLAGDYWVGTFGMEVDDTTDPLTFRTGRAFGSVTLRSNGTLADTQRERICEFDPSSATISCENDSWSDADTTVSVAGPGHGAFEHALILRWNENGQPQELTMLPSADGNIAFDVDDRSIVRDPTVSGGVLVEDERDAGSTRISVGKKGNVVIDSDGDDTVGGLTPDGSFGFVHDSPQTPHGIVGMIFLVRTP